MKLTIITVPVQFNAQLKTSGGGIAVSNLAGEVKANTSGGSIRLKKSWVPQPTPGS